LQKEWEVTLEERLERSTSQNLERIEPQFSVTPSGMQWFDLGVVFATSSGEKFSAAEIQRLKPRWRCTAPACRSPSCTATPS